MTGREADGDSVIFYERGLRGGRPMRGLDFSNYTKDEEKLFFEIQGLVDRGRYAEDILIGNRNLTMNDVKTFMPSAVPSSSLAENECGRSGASHGPEYDNRYSLVVDLI